LPYVTVRYFCHVSKASRASGSLATADHALSRATMVSRYRGLHVPKSSWKLAAVGSTCCGRKRRRVNQSQKSPNPSSETLNSLSRSKRTCSGAGGDGDSAGITGRYERQCTPSLAIAMSDRGFSSGLGHNPATYSLSCRSASVSVAFRDFSNSIMALP